VDEGRKRVILIAAAILAARKLAMHDFKEVPATISAVVNAIDWAFKMMNEVDRRWPGVAKR
jgi:hypothetical protein